MWYAVKLILQFLLQFLLRSDALGFQGIADHAVASGAVNNPLRMTVGAGWM